MSNKYDCSKTFEEISREVDKFCDENQELVEDYIIIRLINAVSKAIESTKIFH